MEKVIEEEGLKILETEIQALANLSTHPHVLPLYG